jgi:hypothetical protein
MAMTTAEVRGWLLVQPRAASVRVHTTDDRQHEVSTTSGTSWRAIAESIMALDPLLIEAYDSDGKILRAVRPHDGAGDDSERPRPPAPMPLAATVDPQSAMLIHFADLLASAYRHSTDVAFERLTNLFEAVNRRSEALEASLEATHQLLRKAWREQLENAEPPKPEGDLLNELVNNFAAGAVGARSGSPSNGSPQNGKA